MQVHVIREGDKHPFMAKFNLEGDVDRDHSDTEDEEAQYASMPYAPAGFEGVGKVAFLIELPYFPHFDRVQHVAEREDAVQARINDDNRPHGLPLHLVESIDSIHDGMSEEGMCLHRYMEGTLQRLAPPFAPHCELEGLVTFAMSS